MGPGLGKLQKLTDHGVDIEFRWIRAHTDIWGNGAIDQLAKDAATATQRGSPEEHDTRHDRSTWLAAAAKLRIRAEARKEWELAWTRTPFARRTKKIHENPTKQVLEYRYSQRKATASIMMQLRTAKSAWPPTLLRSI